MSFPRHLFHYQFFPVGQGLFAYGDIVDEPNEKCRFQWVYDCGTSSSQDMIDSGISKIERQYEDRKCIDLLAISHFDKDHISGICKLIGRFKNIGTLMLPYMPLEQRLIHAYKENTGLDDPDMSFFINPVRYLTSLGDNRIGRILFVPPSGNEGPSMSGGMPPSPDLSEDNFNIDFQSGEPPEKNEFGSTSESGKSSVNYLKKGSAISISKYWEFIAYNDDPEDEIPESFREKVKAESSNLLREGIPNSQRNQTLKELKNIYDSQFGGKSEQRNAISLFLYAGPIYSNQGFYTLGRCSFELCEFPFRFPHRHWHHLWPVSLGACSILYTGDGFLDTTNKLSRLVNFLSQARIDRTGVFQVMHHGAKRNWHKGVAEAIKPIVSVFSSDPHHKKLGHPHAEVLRDFWPYCPVRVDKREGHWISGLFDYS
ncbi:MAG: hypothetical protein NTX50_16505 [Candidatus Sumerlaeota bacterium]|nr:hypothetical protein [Candidatus Sumerlaeota bacterium]